MSAGTMSPFVARIGETAGKVWHHLNDHGPRSMTKLAAEIGEPRDMVMMAIGWLAREDKVEITEDRRARLVRLK